MSRRFAFVALALALVPASAYGEPVKLKFAYFTSDRTAMYRTAIGPFVEAVNAEGEGIVEIEVAGSGALGRNPVQQLQLVRDGTADLAFLVTGYMPQEFPDNRLLELPGLFRDIREATLVYTRLVAANALEGYRDLLVVGALSTEPETIHTREPAASLDDLQGKRIRVNNDMEAAALEQLGLVPVEFPITKVATAISTGEIDGALVPPGPMIEFGIARVAANHFMLDTSVAPLALVMSRDRFESMPAPARDVIERFSGEWMADRYISLITVENEAALASLRADGHRTVVTPSPADLARVETAFGAVADEWLASDPRNVGLLDQAKAMLADIRAGN